MNFGSLTLFIQLALTWLLPLVSRSEPPLPFPGCARRSPVRVRARWERATANADCEWVDVAGWNSWDSVSDERFHVLFSRCSRALRSACEHAPRERDLPRKTRGKMDPAPKRTVPVASPSRSRAAGGSFSRTSVASCFHRVEQQTCATEAFFAALLRTAAATCAVDAVCLVVVVVVGCSSQAERIYRPRLVDACW